MTIQQVTSGSSSGIMNFLFQDDGSSEGIVADGADFSRTLHQLLGEFDDGDAALAENTTASQDSTQTLADAELADTLVSAAAPEEVATPALSADLKSLTTDFTLPAQVTALPAGVAQQNTAEGAELPTPFWHSAAFNETASDATQHVVVPLDITQIRDPAATHAEITPETTAYDTPAANDPAFTPPAAPTFNKGIEHVVTLARQSEQLSAELTQQSPQDLTSASPPAAAMPPPQEGRTRPASGKFLPLTFRQATSNQAVAGAHGKAQTNQASAIGLPAAGDTALLSATENTNFFAELLSGETRTQPASQNASAVPQGIQGLRHDTALPTMPRALAAEASANPAPQISSPYIAGTDAWLQDLGTRVEWLKDKDMTTAELQLHPAELGSLEIHISTVDDATTVSFVTHNAAAREIIEESMPRLREMFAGQGMQLGESHVSQQSAEGQRGGQDANSQNRQQQNTGDSVEAKPERRGAYLADPNRIDHYV